MANGLSTSQRYETILGEEEIFDVSLATFNVFDRENGRVFNKEKGSSYGGGCISAWYSIAGVQQAPPSGLPSITLFNK